MCLRVFITDFYQPLRNLSQLHSKTMSIETVVLGIHRVNDLKTGTLIGTDKYGNKYYEDKRNFFGMCANVNTSQLTVQLCIDCIVSAGEIELVCPTSLRLTCVSRRERAHRNALTSSVSFPQYICQHIQFHIITMG